MNLNNMRGKRFRTKKHAHNMRIWGMFSIVLVILATLFSLSTSQFTVLWVVLGLCGTGLVISAIRDKKNRCSYYLEDNVLKLRNWSETESLELAEVTDASLIDRRAARDYVVQKVSRLEEEGMSRKVGKELIRTFVKFCSVDIGLSSFSFGIGTNMTDRLQSVRGDLVLLRMKDGTDLLLSPTHPPEMVSNISRGVASLFDALEAPARSHVV